MANRQNIQCCAYVSIAGVLFLSALGGLLHLQPEYIRGLTHAVPKQKLALNCWIGAGLYAAAWVVCFATLTIQARHEARFKKKSYDLRELRRTLSSWDDLGMPPRLEKHDVMPPDHDDSGDHQEGQGQETAK